MNVPAIHPREEQRIAALNACRVLDTASEPEFDGLALLAAGVLGAPIALISLVDRERQWFKARRGLEAHETPRSISFCGHAILDESRPFIVEDASQDPRFADNPLVVGEPRVICYVGIPLRVGPDRLPIGTLCVVDHRPRSVTPEQLAELLIIGRQAELIFELRLKQQDLEDRLAVSRRREEYVQAVVTAMHEGLAVRGPDGKVVSCNPAAERILGLTADQIMGRTPTAPGWSATRADGSDFSAAHHPSKVAMRTGQPVRDVLVSVGTGPGDRRWVLVNTQPIGCDPKSKPDGVVVSFTDVTALRHVEAERRRAEEEVERFFTLSLDLLCIVTAAGRFVRINPAWTALLGWSMAELEAISIFDLVHPDDRQAALAEANRLDGGGSATMGFEGRFRCRDSSWRVLSWAAARVPENGLLMAVARDVTRSRADEAELRRAKEAAEASTRAANEFLAGMSHEIRTPMNGVIGLTEVLLGTSIDGEQREMLQSIQVSGTALLDILNAILDWSRIEAGRLELESVPVDIIKIAREVVTVLTPFADTKGLALTLEASRPAPTVLGDAGRVRQVLFNLLGNALKFTFEGEVAIRVSTMAASVELPGGAARVEVSDTGIGMAKEALPRLFNRFSQLDASTTRRFGGTGLGLAITRELIRSMGGSISAKSEPGRGSTFTVELPLAVAAHLPHAQPDLPLPGPAPRPLRILVAEDNSINRRVASALLTRDGHHVELALNGRAALAAYLTGSWDLVLMDVQMPEMDGIAATRAIRDAERASGRRPVSIIALTASAMPHERLACLAAGMDDVLAKPLTGDGLRRLLLSVS